MENEQKFKDMFTIMAERYDKAPSQVLSKMLWDALKPFSDQECITAFGHVFRHGRFFKDLIPDLFEVLGKGGVKQIGNTAEIEVDKILCHFNQYGGSRWPEMTDPVTKHLMTSRWPYETWARHVLTSELTWWRKEFITAYLAYKASDTPLQIEATKPVLKLISGIGG
jgi:hypothetical protein